MTQNKNYGELKAALLNIEAEDLSSLSPGSDEDGNLYRHDGSTSISTVNGSSEKAGLYLWDNSESDFKGVSVGGLEELDLKEQDLSTLSLDSTDDGTVFYHDGSNPITTTSGTSTSEGLYEWDSSQSAFKPVGLNEDISPTWTDSHIFQQGLATGGDITSLDLNAPIWDESVGEVPDNALGSIDNATLTNDSLTISSGDGLVGGGSVALGDSSTIDIDSTIWNSGGSYIEQSALENDSLTVTAGTGLSNGGLVSLGGSTTLDLTNDSVTINSGTGLSGGGSVALGNSLSLTHADTSSQADLSVSGATVVNALTLDGFGHITNANTQNRDLNDWSVPNQVNISSANRFQLPNRTSDPAADPGDMWYRTDLD